MISIRQILILPALLGFAHAFRRSSAPTQTPAIIDQQIVDENAELSNSGVVHVLVRCPNGKTRTVLSQHVPDTSIEEVAAMFGLWNKISMDELDECEDSKKAEEPVDKATNPEM